MQELILTQEKSNSLFIQAAIVLAASLFVGVCAHISIPFFPVPLTLQTFAVLIIGGLLGPYRATLAVAAYLVEGVMGLPFFGAGGASLAHLFGPTGGYIFGFFPAAALMGFLSARLPHSLSFISILSAALVSSLCIYALGLPWLSNYVGWQNAVAWGLTPFILGDLIKISVASIILTGINRSNIKL